MIRELDVAVLRDTIAPLLPEINYTIPPDVLARSARLPRARNPISACRSL